MIVNKPPKGWNSWNTFGPNVNEQVMKDAADALVSTGLRDLGYEYVCLDDCWSMPQRDENGRIVENREKFPSGIKALADYIHERGLKFGMYGCAGLRTCAGFPGSFDREFIDAQTFADFGADLLKYDYCNFPETAHAIHHYNRMSMALKTTGRDILFSVCNWGCDRVETWIRSVGAHMYRSTGDIHERFESIRDIARSQFLEKKLRYSAPGCYNDLDMLVVGMDGNGIVGHPGHCGDWEYRSHLALWCMLGAPLMIGCDLTKIRPEILELLKKPELLRIVDDEECRPPMFGFANGKLVPVMFKHLSGGEFAIAMFNLDDYEREVILNPWEFGLTNEAGFGLKIKEIFSGFELNPVPERFALSLEAHHCRVFLGSYIEK